MQIEREFSLAARFAVGSGVNLVCISGADAGIWACVTISRRVASKKSNKKDNSLKLATILQDKGT